MKKFRIGVSRNFVKARKLYLLFLFKDDLKRFKKFGVDGVDFVVVTDSHNVFFVVEQLLAEKDYPTFV